jgi:hypothetical protein
MSFLGFDLLGSVSISGFLSGDDEISQAEGTTITEATIAQEAAEGTGEALTLTTITTPGTVQNEVSSPPLIIEVNLEERNFPDEDSRDDGITIVSSAPSLSDDVVMWHHVAAAPTRRQEIFAFSPHPQLSTEHALSISTRESVFTTNTALWMNSAEQSPNSSTFLSLNPSSLASSVVTDMSFSASRCSDDDMSRAASPPTSSPSLLTPSSPTSVSSSVALVPVDSHEWVLVSRTNLPESHASKQIWYETILTEEDWRIFRERALTILAAVGVTSGQSPEKVLGLLIQQEEEEIWNKNKKSRCLWLAPFHRSLKWKLLGETAAVAAAAAFASMGIHMLVRR